MVKGLNQSCVRCGVVHFALETEADGDLVHFQLVVSRWPCPAVSTVPRLADTVATALTGGRAA